MALPKTLVYNDLSGDEVKHILLERFAALLADVPYLQKHLTLPRVKMSLQVTLDCWADQATPERRSIEDQLEVRGESYELSSEVDASRRGQKPDEVREQHGLDIPTPSTFHVGGLARTEDTPVEGRAVVMPNGVIIDRTGQSPEARSNSTVVKQDFGPAREGRRYSNFGNSQREGPAAPPNFREFDSRK